MLVTMEEIRSAQTRIAGTTVVTPLVPASFARESQPMFLKAESLQVGGAFKARGATNAVAVLMEHDGNRLKECGVVTHSSGNHGQGVARAAQALGIAATVVMPRESPEVKLRVTESLGARVVLVDSSERASKTEQIQAETGATFVPPYDDRNIIAGQGTVGLEILSQLPDVETVLVPVGGGGLISGIATAIKAQRPTTRVIAVEPELAGDLAEGWARGERVVWSSERTGRTVADGLRVQSVGALNWEHIQEYVDDVVTVREDAILVAMRRIVLEARLVVEPSGAVATAAYLEHPELVGSGPTVAILSGGNVEPELLARVVLG